MKQDKTKNYTPIPKDDILTPEEAGSLFKVSGWAMYKRAQRGQAPAHYIGRKLYFLRSELIASLSNL